MARKRKKRSPVMSILAFVTTIIIVTTFIYLRGKRHKVQELSQFTNTSFNTYQNVYVRDSRRTLLNHPVRKKRLADALWTMKPKIPKRWESQNNNQYIHDDVRGRSFKEDKEKKLLEEDLLQTTPTHIDSTSSLVLFEPKTTPSVTDAPTTPISTQPDTTPLYTASPTSPITTESITTPIVTEPGEIEVTTEIDLENINSETLMLIRNRRGFINGGSTTTPFPLTTSVKPPQCGDGEDSDEGSDSDSDDDDDDDDDYYTGSTGDCKCGIRKSGPYCQVDDDDETIKEKLKKAVRFSTQAIGNFNNNKRKDFHDQIKNHYENQPGFERVFVLPMEYDPVTNRTTISYYVFFDEEGNSRAASRSASITANITSHILPIMIDNQSVSFGEDSAIFIRTKIDGTEESVPLGSQEMQTVCYIFDRIEACLNGGTCESRNGEPYCKCREKYLGEYCAEEVKYAPTDKDTDILKVLLPILAATAAVAAMCSCCFFFLRRSNKGDDVASTYSEESSWIESPKPVILPRYFPFAWRQFIPSEPLEEEDYSYTNVSIEREEVAPIIIERPIIQPVIVERVIVQERPVVPIVINTPSISEVSTEISSPSLILPRFHPTPFRQFIPGPDAEDDEFQSRRFIKL